MENLKAVILAAGKGTRMESDLPKVIHTIDKKPMVEYVIDAVKTAGIQKICLIVGYKAEEVKTAVTSEVSYAYQEEQLGTGHAVKCAKDFIGEQGQVLVLCGDTPLITGKTLKSAMTYHTESQNKLTVISAIVEDPTGYGRILFSYSKTLSCFNLLELCNKCHRLDSLNSNLYFNSSGAWKSKTYVPVALDSSDTSLFGLMASLLLCHMIL